MDDVNVLEELKKYIETELTNLNKILGKTGRNGDFIISGQILSLEEAQKKINQLQGIPPEERCTCIGCGKEPEQLLEYRHMARPLNITPTQAMKENEGTYDKFLKNRFYCTPCYFNAGMPNIPFDNQD